MANVIGRLPPPVTRFITITAMKKRERMEKKNCKY